LHPVLVRLWSTLPIWQYTAELNSGVMQED